VLGQVRGRPHERDGRAVWVTYHPSAAIRFGPNGAPRAALLADLQAVAATL
jgi:DNA polymerase